MLHLIEVFNQEVETIEITEKDVKFFCFGEENEWYDFWGLDEYLADNKTYTDAWYVFFNTDKEIDTLKEIEITYQPYDYQVECMGGVLMSKEFTRDSFDTGAYVEESVTDGKQTIVTITPGTVKISASDNFWGGYETKYEELDKIMDLREYDYTDENGNEFVFTEQAKKYTWGVNFLNTEKKSWYDSLSYGGGSVTTYVVDGTGVRNTAIIRLKYEVNGIVKNAYAIDVPTDDFTGDSANTDIGEDWFEKIMFVLTVVVVISVLNVLQGPVKLLFDLIGGGVKFIVTDILLPVIKLPFAFIGWIFSLLFGK